MGSRSLPRPRFAQSMRSGAGLSDLLSIAYDYDVLGLGPDSPWVDWRCPGTLRLSVWEVVTPIDATHSGIRASLRSTCPSGHASQLHENAPLRRDQGHTRSFGGLLEPR